MNMGLDWGLVVLMVALAYFLGIIRMTGLETLNRMLMTWALTLWFGVLTIKNRIF
jgi:hypothetical protein